MRQMVCVAMLLWACGDDDGVVDGGSDAAMPDAALDSAPDTPLDGGSAGTCANPLEITDEVMPGVFRVEGTTAGAASSESGSCSEERGPEVVYSWTAAADGFVEARLSGPDPVLYVREACDAAAELACNDDENDSTLNSRVVFRAVAGTTYSIIADSYDAEDVGPFTLTLDTNFVPLEVPEGTWVSRGYGYAVESNGGDVTLYEHTSISCIAILEGSAADLEGLIREIEIESADTFLLWPVGVIAPYAFDRTALPDTCADGGTPVFGDPDYDDDPLQLWDILDATFEEFYAHFERRGVDWTTRSAEVRATLSSDSSGLELFDAMSDLLGELRDGHVTLDNGDITFQSDPFPALAQLIEEHADMPGVSLEAYIDESLAQYLDNIEAQLVDGFEEDEGDIKWGRLSEDVGYVVLLSVEAADEELFASVLDERLGALADTRALVIDLRVNTGGFDSTSLVFASRFAESRTLALTKAARDGDSYEIYVEPAGTRYEGDVVVLTSESTVSAAEILTLMLRELPQVTVMGQPTNGELSDILSRTLPNGWTFGLSNEVYTAADGEVYEARGVPVDGTIEGELFAREDREAGVDRGLDAVRAFLAE